MVLSPNPVEIGHDMNACKQQPTDTESYIKGEILKQTDTSNVNVYPYGLPVTHTVYLIDTPSGFDHTDRSDNQVLSAFAPWPGDTYRDKILLHEIICLHRISDIRLQGQAKRNLLIFGEFRGEKALGRLYLL